MGAGQILSARVTIPQHVVFRPFVSETVLLNLQTGVYHGINPVGGRMLEVLARAESVREAAAALAEEFGVPPARVEQDVVEFCRGLVERHLIEITPAGAESHPRKPS
jgi:Coenzyme PQQ synthesis protein D (PqqD)